MAMAVTKPRKLALTKKKLKTTARLRLMHRMAWRHAMKGTRIGLRGRRRGVCSTGSRTELLAIVAARARARAMMTTLEKERQVLSFFKYLQSYLICTLMTV